MCIPKKLARWLGILLAVLALVISAAGIYGVWWAHQTATDYTIRTFAVIDTAAGIANSGVGQANGLVLRGRAEVQQVESTINALGDHIQENNPVLTALSNRVSDWLAPTVGQIRDVLEPVTKAVQSARAVVDFVNAFPFIRETPPAVAQLESALNRLDEAVADARQINDTIRSSITGGANQLTGNAVGALTTLTGRVDGRLADVQTAMEAVQAEVLALQQRAAVLRARLLLTYNLTAIGLTLFLLWVIYSQVVVILHHGRRLDEKEEAAPALAPPAAALELAPAPAPPVSEPAPAYPSGEDAAL